METIKEIYLDVERIEIDYDIQYSSAFGLIRKNGTATYLPDYAFRFKIDCVNIDCTGSGFDMYIYIASAVGKKQTEVSGSLRCTGNEAHDHKNSCDTKMDYTIRIEYRTGSHQ